jgi:hypothetical protein
MKKLDAKHYATAEYRYWCFSPETDGMMFFRDKAERDKYAAAEIEACLDSEGWAEWVDQICCGEVTHLAEKTDIQQRPDTEEGREEVNWNDDFDEICNYRLGLIPAEPFVQAPREPSRETQD